MLALFPILSRLYSWGVYNEVFHVKGEALEKNL